MYCSSPGVFATQHEMNIPKKKQKKKKRRWDLHSNNHRCKNEKPLLKSDSLIVVQDKTKTQLKIITQNTLTTQTKA